MNIAGAGVVITGGASGIGKAVAHAMAEKAGRIAIFDLNEAAGQVVARDLGAGALFEKVNVADENSVASAIAKTMGAWARFTFASIARGSAARTRLLAKTAHSRWRHGTKPSQSI